MGPWVHLAFLQFKPSGAGGPAVPRPDRAGAPGCGSPDSAALRGDAFLMGGSGDRWGHGSYGFDPVRV